MKRKGYRSWNLQHRCNPDWLSEGATDKFVEYVKNNMSWHKVKKNHIIFVYKHSRFIFIFGSQKIKTTFCHPDIKAKSKEKKGNYNIYKLKDMLGYFGYDDEE